MVDAQIRKPRKPRRDAIIVTLMLGLAAPIAVAFGSLLFAIITLLMLTVMLFVTIDICLWSITLNDLGISHRNLVQRRKHVPWNRMAIKVELPDGGLILLEKDILSKSGKPKGMMVAMRGADLLPEIREYILARCGTLSVGEEKSSATLG